MHCYVSEVCSYMSTCVGVPVFASISTPYPCSFEPLACFRILVGMRTLLTWTDRRHASDLAHGTIVGQTTQRIHRPLARIAPVPSQSELRWSCCLRSAASFSSRCIPWHFEAWSVCPAHAHCERRRWLQPLVECGHSTFMVVALAYPTCVPT